jgi:hypothetical protein
LTPSPIGKVLSIFRKHRVRALLMGGQACILYGAAEFSRDIDIAVATDEKNLSRLRLATRNSQAYNPSQKLQTTAKGVASCDV